MSLLTKTERSTKSYWALLESVGKLLRESDAILIGAGAGLSAAGGLRYDDESRAKAIFPAHRACGLTTIMELLSAFWVVTPENATAFWAVWSRHIHEMVYCAPVLEPYQRLFTLMRDKNYFVISTNVDGQFARAGFPQDKRFEPQGQYSRFQCATPCRQEVFDNKAMVETMLANMPSPLAVRSEDVPRCPHCGNLLMPNLRCDDRFVEGPNTRNFTKYASFVERYRDKRLVLLELGVGFNSPGVIRHPFDSIARTFPKSHLVRINFKDVEVQAAGKRGVGIKADLNKVLGDLIELYMERN